jgi:hypothetical protein
MLAQIAKDACFHRIYVKQCCGALATKIANAKCSYELGKAFGE